MGTLFFACVALAAGTEPSAGLAAIHIRDPFILAVPEEKKYYLFGTHAGRAIDFLVHTSADLRSWQGPVTAFARPADFWADRDFWAPEVHRYKGRYFMLASFKAADAHRGTRILVADAPQGPYHIHSTEPVTPRDWECLDGTLYVDEDRQPWIVFCHEWTQVHDGEICALRLAPELDKAVGNPVFLFRASEAPWVSEVGFGDRNGLVTDGPFLHRTRNGTLIMLWSSFLSKGSRHKPYALAVARSETGKITGPWKQDPEPLFSDDGGHGMLFRTFDSTLMLSLHQPNGHSKERTRLFTVQEDGAKLTCTPWPE